MFVDKNALIRKQARIEELEKKIALNSETYETAIKILEKQISDRDDLIREAYIHIDSITIDFEWLKRAREVLGE